MLGDLDSQRNKQYYSTQGVKAIRTKPSTKNLVLKYRRMRSQGIHMAF